MKKLKIQKQLLQYVSDDDMAFIEAYNLLKTPKEPNKGDYVLVKYSVIRYESASITKEMLADWAIRIENGSDIYLSSDCYIKERKVIDLTADYLVAKSKYDERLNKYLSSYESLHPIVVSIMAKAKEKYESEVNGYDSLPDNIDELKEIIKKNKIKL